MPGTKADRLSQTDIEMATGLSLDDIAMLKADGSDEVRAEIAVKFARQYDGLNRSQSRKLTEDLLRRFAKDRSRRVRQRFAEEICASLHMPHDLALSLARDELEIAGPILEMSTLLTDDDLAAIVKEMSEGYGLAIAGRKPLSETISGLLIKHKGTVRVISRLIDNDQACLSDDALDWIFDWGQSNPMIAERLKKRPHLPFDLTQKYVTALGHELKWNAVIKQIMTKDEATQILHQISGPARQQLSRGSKRLQQTVQAIRNRHEAGLLKPTDIIGLLRDQNVALMELSFAVATRLDLKRVRYLLYGCDKRGLVALCLRAGFTTSEYIAFRMALGLAELGGISNQINVTYDTSVTQFAQDQFEAMRAQPQQVSAWIDGRHGMSDAAFL